MVNKTWNGIEFVYDFVSSVAGSFIDNGSFKLTLNGHNVDVWVDCYNGCNLLVVDGCQIALRKDDRIYIHTTNCSYNEEDEYKFFNSFIKLLCGELFRKSYMYGLKVEPVYDHVANVVKHHVLR